MAMRHLGPTFDIHTGGIDNVFPHHEGEIAQSAPLVGGPPARVWVHGEFLQVGGQKMAKSAGNIERVAELPERGIDPLAFRYLTLTSRYRHRLEYTDASLAGAAAGLASLRSRLATLGPPPLDGPWAAPASLRCGAAPARPIGTASGIAGHGSPDAAAYKLGDRAHAPVAPLSAAGRTIHARFVDAIDDDLDLPTALAVVREVVASPDLSPDERRWLVLDADLVLGLDLDRVWSDATETEVPADIGRRVEARTAARAAGDYASADAIRAELADEGWDITDGPDGPTVRARSRVSR